MRRSVTHCLLLLAAAGLLAVAPIPAQAVITPTGSTVSMTSSNAFLSSAGMRIVCPRADFTGTVDAVGRSLSGRLFLGPSGGVDCMETSIYRLRVEVFCTGNLTLRETSSTVGTSVTYVLDLDRGFECSFSIGSGICRLTIRGQQRLSGGSTFIQRDQTLTTDFRTIVVTADNPSFICRSSTAGAFGGSFRVTTGRITVS